tara:strand:- start:316 stop:540 length:225 start_codon:yes stop_codon:yes gene_type:complete
MITKDSLKKRKEVLLKDINDVKLRAAEYEKKRIEDVALLNGLSGAFQQCEIFLKELDNDESEMANDVENSPEED